jgi:hypothetical protein
MMKRTLLPIASFSLAGICCLGLILATEPQAHAYIDPGSGLLALQSAGAAVAALGYFLRRRVRAIFGAGKKTPEPIEPASVPVAIAAKDTSRAA